jgi:hypothetical protein
VSAFCGSNQYPENTSMDVTKRLLELVLSDSNNIFFKVKPADW